MKKDESQTKERWTWDENKKKERWKNDESNTEFWSDWSSSKARMY